MIKLTKPGGEEVWVSPAWIQLIELPEAHEYVETGGSVRSVLVLSGERRAVLESPKEIATALANAAALIK